MSSCVYSCIRRQSEDFTKQNVYKLCKIWVNRRGPNVMTHLHQHKFFIAHPKEPSFVANIIAWISINGTSKTWMLQLLCDLCDVTRRPTKRQICLIIKTLFNLQSCQDQAKAPSLAGYWCEINVGVTESSLRDIQFEDLISPVRLTIIARLQ